MKQFISLVILICFVACGVQNIPDVVDDQDTMPSIVRPQDLSTCSKELDFPHKSVTISTEIVVKGQLKCGRSNEFIIATATITLLKSGIPVGTRSKSAELNALTSVTITRKELVAAAPCVTGNYSGRIEAKYVNATGFVVALSIPLVGPELFVDCSVIGVLGTVNIAYTNNLPKAPVGKTVTGTATFKNNGSFPMDWKASVPAAATWLKLASAGGTAALGQTTSLAFTATCTKLGTLSADITVTNLTIVGEVRTAKVTITCEKTVKTSVRVTTPYNGSTQLCPRVKGAMDYEFIGITGTITWQFLIDGNPSNIYEYTDSGSTITFASTRSCNLSVGNHNLQVKVVDSQGIVIATSAAAAFAVTSNQWAGFISNDTNNCAGLPGLAMDFTANAAGASEQRQNAVQPGNALAVFIRGGLTYTFQGIYTGTSVGSSTTYTLPAPFEGDPISINGRTGFYGASFTQPCPDPALLRTQSGVQQLLTLVDITPLTTEPTPITLPLKVP